MEYEAAEYLACLPVRAFGTDAANVFSADDEINVDGDLAITKVAPIHYSFLS